MSGPGKYPSRTRPKSGNRDRKKAGSLFRREGALSRRTIGRFEAVDVPLASRRQVEGNGRELPPGRCPRKTASDDGSMGGMVRAKGAKRPRAGRPSVLAWQLKGELFDALGEHRARLADGRAILRSEFRGRKRWQGRVGAFE